MKIYQVHGTRRQAVIFADTPEEAVAQPHVGAAVSGYELIASALGNDHHRLSLIVSIASTNHAAEKPVASAWG